MKISQLANRQSIFKAASVAGYVVVVGAAIVFT